MFIWGQHLFEAWRLLEEILYLEELIFLIKQKAG